MVINQKDSTERANCWEIRGWSDEEKPTKDIPEGSSFFEMDTGDVWFWRQSKQEWILPRN